MKRGLSIVTAMGAVLACGTLALAQDQNPGGGGGNNGGNGNGGGGMGRRNGGGGGGGDPAQFRQRMMDRLKDDLGASDDEFKVLQPKLEKVQTLQRDARPNGFGGGRRGGGGPGGGGPGGGGPGGGGPGGGGAQPAGEQSAVQKATADLRETLQDKSAAADVIATKLTALRDARTKAQTDFKAAQDDLKGVLTARQEAVLVTYGLLD